MDVSNRFQAWSLETVFVSSDERHHLHPDAEPDVWRRGALLGSGGFGDVFTERCVDGPRRHQTRAVKQIRKSPDAWRLVQRELGVLVDCATDDNKHDSRDNFVRFLGWFGDSTHLYIAMELVPFGDLQSHISTRPCSERSTAVIIEQVGRALQFMHERSFVHRDLKPANILVARPCPDWHVKLTDFGISKNIDNTELRTQVGTAAYMAPELFERNDANIKITSAVDIWSLGAVAFCARTGKAPFANTYELCKFSSGTTRFPTQPLMRSSGAFVDFIFRLMEKLPAGRPTMAEALEHDWVV
ncbi:kinase-like domain-containing protein, partial [Plectosphaerella plurivora]